jgi:adenine deaminase
MMNFPGVLAEDPQVLSKLELARKHNKPVDGHAPGLMGDKAKQYIDAGISTDHECFTIEEAREKLRYGMKILIREGSAARNFDDLAPIIGEAPGMVMFCSDDRHPDDLVKRHIDDLVRRAINLGYDPIDVIRCCTLNPVRHYNLESGLLQQGDPADFIVVDNMSDFNIKETYIDGALVAKEGKTRIKTVPEKAPNKFLAGEIAPRDLEVYPDGRYVKVIEALEGQLITHELDKAIVSENTSFESDIERDILKIVVLNRYEDARPAVGYVTNFGLKMGAIASTVAHDSHNIIAVGASDSQIAKAINALVVVKGGVCCVRDDDVLLLPLPVAGLMSNGDGYQVASAYERVTEMAHGLGSKLLSPFMTLSFMALLVIPELKLSDKGLFDGKTFSFTPVFTSS